MTRLTIIIQRSCATVLAALAAGAVAAPSAGDVAQACPSGWICPSTPIYDSQIGIWYSVWFDGVAPGGSCGTASASRWCGSRYRPVRGYYDSSSTAVIDAQIAEMKSIGANFAVLDYTNGIVPSPNDVVFRNGQAFIARDNALFASQAHIPFAMAIGAGLWASHSLAEHDNEAKAVYDSYYSRNPNIYYKHGGKPLLVNYNAYGDPLITAPGWNDSRFSVGRATAHLSTGNAEQMKYGADWWGWVVEFPQPLSSQVMTVTPGADSLHAGSGPAYAYHIDRAGGPSLGCGSCGSSWSPALVTTPADGLLFQQQWLRAIKQNPRTIMIASYNEFVDENAIEPAYARTDLAQPVPAWKDYYGTETPDWYLQIARAYGQLRKGLMNGGYYQDEDSFDIYGVVDGSLVRQSAYPHGHPVIRLPAGTLKALLPPAPSVTPPPDGTMMTSNGLPPSLVVGGVQLWFESFSALQRLSASTLAVSREFYTSIPFAGVIRQGGPAYATAGYPPVFESDRGEMWLADCLDVFSANGSTIQSIPGPLYSSYPFRSGVLRCH